MSLRPTSSEPVGKVYHWLGKVVEFGIISPLATNPIPTYLVGGGEVDEPWGAWLLWLEHALEAKE